MDALDRDSRFDDGNVAAGCAGRAGRRRGGHGHAGQLHQRCLQTALNGGGLVTFNCGAAPATILSNTYVISVNTIVDGAGLITLDGENLRQHFRVQPDVSLTLRNLNLNKAICLRAARSTTGHPGDRKHAFNNKRPPMMAARFITWPRHVVINGASFTSNTVPLASGYGGAISTPGVLTVTGATFTQNEARYGGAIFTGGSSRASIASSAFNTNKAQLYGGGLYMNNNLSEVR